MINFTCGKTVQDSCCTHPSQSHLNDLDSKCRDCGMIVRQIQQPKWGLRTEQARNPIDDVIALADRLQAEHHAGIRQVKQVKMTVGEMPQTEHSGTAVAKPVSLRVDRLGGEMTAMLARATSLLCRTVLEPIEGIAALCEEVASLREHQRHLGKGIKRADDAHANALFEARVLRDQLVPLKDENRDLLAENARLRRKLIQRDATPKKPTVRTVDGWRPGFKTGVIR